jgi:bifunctional NMN adenylyltransferase/nudix hydrolase
MSDVAFVIGRFQPYHKGHHALIHRAFQCADHVVVIIGDTGCHPDFRNPWTFEERSKWITEIWDNEKSEHQRLVCVQVEDIPYNDAAWVAQVKEKVGFYLDSAYGFGWGKGGGKRTLVGHKKDDSSFYLDLFPEWEFVEVAPQHTAGATYIRELFFQAADYTRVANMLHPVVTHGLLHMPMVRYNAIQKEANEVYNHKADWDCNGSAMYGSQHVAVDLLLHTDTHVALIERGGDVGSGALALAGGFVEKSERLIEATLREAEEELGVRIPRDWFPSHGIGVMIPFDHPRRSMRGRIFTNVLPMHVADHLDWNLTAGDDAKKANWYPRADLASMKRRFFSDHWHIIDICFNHGVLK